MGNAAKFQGLTSVLARTEHDKKAKENMEFQILYALSGQGKEMIAVVKFKCYQNFFCWLRGDTNKHFMILLTC